MISHAYIKDFFFKKGNEQETENSLIFRGRCPDFAQAGVMAMQRVFKHSLSLDTFI